MEPISALSLVANIFEVISFSSELVSKGNQINLAANGLLKENTTAGELANDLSQLTSRLSKSQTAWGKAHRDNQSDPDEARLRDICDNCSNTANELNLKLEKLKLQEGVKFRRLRAYRQALISVWKEDEVEAVASRLQDYQRELDTHILVGLRKSASQADIRSNEHFATLDRKTQEVILSVLEVDKKLDVTHAKLDDHAHLLGQVYENTNHILAIQRSPSPAPPYEELASSRPLTTALHTAAATGDVLKVRQALRHPGVDVNAKDENYCTPLHLATTAGVVERLIATGRVKLDEEDKDLRTVLHHAVIKRRLWVVKALLEAGISQPTQQLEDIHGRTALFYAQNCNAARWMLNYGPATEVKPKELGHTGLLHMAWLGDVEGTQFFLDQGAQTDVLNNAAKTALGEACRHGSADVVKLLLNARSEVNPSNDRDWTPLLQAIRDDRVEIVRLLLAHKASKDARLARGNNAVAEACARGHHEIARILILDGSSTETLNDRGRTCLLEASMRNDGEWTRFLLSRHARKDVYDKEGCTPVWHAANGGHDKTLAALLDHGCPKEMVSSGGSTPLACAARKNFAACVKLLIDAEAALDTRQGNGYTALHEASHHGHVEVVELFVQHSANLDIGDKDGFSPLSVAAYNGRDAVVRLLANAQADINRKGLESRSGNGIGVTDTPVMRAIGNGKTSTALLLIELGATLDHDNRKGKTALTKAAAANNVTVVQALLAKGVDVDAKRARKEETALMIAAAKGNTQIVSLLLNANANPRLKDWRGCTAWNIAVQANQDRKLEALLGPGSAEDEDAILRKLQQTAEVDEIAAYMNSLDTSQGTPPPTSI